MLETYSQNISVTTDAIIPLNVNALKKNCTVTHTEGSSTISLNKPGVYAVYVDATGSTTDAGTFGVQLLKNGTAVTQATASATTAAGGTSNVSFAAMVFIAPSCSCVSNKGALTLQYTGGAGTVANVDVMILKVS